MRKLIPVLLLCSIAFCAQAGDVIRLPSTYVIDLDKPGTLEALQRDNPKHYDAVMKKVDEAQVVQLSDKGTRNLGLFMPDPVTPFGAQGDLKLSSPAQSRITVLVEATAYAITVRHTKDPAHLVPAR